MKKLLYKLCLCGMLMYCINHELAYSTTPAELHDFLNNPSSYISDYSTNTKYEVDLFSFTFDNNTIDYSKIPNKMPKNIQFVINENYKGNKNITLKPANDKITIRKEFGNYPGILSLDKSIKQLDIINSSKKTRSYIIKMNEDVKIRTKGNINLFLDNNTIKLGGIKNFGGYLSVYQYGKSNELEIKVPASNFSSIVNSTIQLNSIDTTIM